MITLKNVDLGIIYNNIYYPKDVTTTLRFESDLEEIVLNPNYDNRLLIDNPNYDNRSLINGVYNSNYDPNEKITNPDYDNRLTLKYNIIQPANVLAASGDITVTASRTDDSIENGYFTLIPVKPVFIYKRIENSTSITFVDMTFIDNYEEAINDSPIEFQTSMIVILQRSNSISGPWNDLHTITNNEFTFNNQVDTWYRCKFIISNKYCISYSNPIHIKSYKYNAGTRITSVNHTELKALVTDNYISGEKGYPINVIFDSGDISYLYSFTNYVYGDLPGNLNMVTIDKNNCELTPNTIGFTGNKNIFINGILTTTDEIVQDVITLYYEIISI